ncbi:hypothetical protein As57867_003804, partial [Aphanomyces stellatus]
SALSATGSDGALSWHLVAGVFRANSWRSMANRRTLLEQTLANDVLTRNMRRFVSLNLQALPTRPRCIMWQPATLLAQPEARKLGKEWLTQRMYHHTDEALHRSFPADVSIDQEYAHYDTTVSDDGSITCFEAVQNIWPSTMDTYRAFLNDHLHMVLFRDPSNLAMEHVSNTKLFNKLTPKGTLVNFLQGYFVEANRVVVVLRQIEADEAVGTPAYKQQAHFMAWLEARQLSPTQVVTRLVTRQSQHFRPNEEGFFSLDEQAEFWEVDLGGASDKMEAMREAISRQGYETVQQWREMILAVLAKLKTAAQTNRSES